MSQQPDSERDPAGGGGDVVTTIARALREAADALGDASVEEPRREAATLLAATLARDRAYLIAHSDDALAPDALKLFRDGVRRRAAGEPTQYVTGRQEFYGLDFEVSPAVLIPRPETELLVETTLDLLRDVRAPRVCDVGAGSGCVAVALLHERADARAVAVDISADALRVAARNAARHAVAGRLALVASDCFAALDPSHKFDLIASNPPYVAEGDLDSLQREVREHEPRVALTPGGDGLSVIRRLLEDAPRFLREGGCLVFEIGFDQHEAVRRLIDARVWTLLEIHKDLQGIPRTVALRLNG
ncbi:MAG: peptide chain release factor N(5)-glutamine methyltransferase [Acidobacteria bacterium]|nr:peptide chain release factor N(5)-glutamine methyltransferase [Acidobacteriota bacterium]MCA1642549.1 peptide chain release factor N(5)-glutamine methyltransferase [Acidobacteriota bacterium]